MTEPVEKLAISAGGVVGVSLGYVVLVEAFRGLVAELGRATFMVAAARLPAQLRRSRDEWRTQVLDHGINYIEQTTFAICGFGANGFRGFVFAEANAFEASECATWSSPHVDREREQRQRRAGIRAGADSPRARKHRRPRAEKAWWSPRILARTGRQVRASPLLLADEHPSRSAILRRISAQEPPRSSGAGRFHMKARKRQAGEVRVLRVAKPPPSTSKREQARRRSRVASLRGGCARQGRSQRSDRFGNVAQASVSRSSMTSSVERRGRSSEHLRCFRPKQRAVGQTMRYDAQGLPHLRQRESDV